MPTGAGPDTYQWFENGSPVSGATDRILTFPAIVGAGGSFSLAISNGFSGLVTTPQQVVIQPNLAPPSVVSVKGVAGSINKIFLTFNQTLDPVSYTHLDVYKRQVNMSFA